MIRWFTFFLFLLFCISSFGATKGWVCVIELSEFKCQVGGTNPDGTTFYVGQLTGRKARQERYVAGSSRPSLANFGTDYNRDLAGNAKPSTPYTFPFVIWQVSGFQSWGVNDSLQGADFSGLGNLNLDKYLSPVYVASSDYPYSFTLSDGYYSGVNSQFGSNGSLNIVQGEIGSSNSAIPNHYYYDPNYGSLIITDTPNSNMGTYTWDSGTGDYVYSPAVETSGGDLNLTPVVSAIESQGGYTRSQLVELLGSSGNSWVYDCKLSLSQLYTLASDSGVLVRSPDFRTIDYSIQSLESTLALKDFSPTINVAAPNVTVNPSQVNIDTSSLAKESTLQYFKSLFDLYFPSYDTVLYEIENDSNMTFQRANSINNILSSWDNTSVPSIPAPSGYEITDDNDGLPVGLKSFYADDSPTSVGSTVQRLGDYVEWGSSGAPQVFDVDFLSGFLTSIIGSVPSVGSDGSMFSIDFELPVIGRIQRTYSWSDFPYIGEFRMFLVWVLYLFFGLACFKLLHKTLI